MRLQLDSMEVDCVIGDLPGERDREQTLSIDVTLEVSDGAAESDSIADTVDYALLAGNVARALKAARCRMIERAAKIAWDECMAFPNTLAAKVRVSKRGAVARLAGASAEYCGADGPFADGAGPRIETIARGICIEDGRLLVCRAKGSSTCYLPGGHVEFGESAREALRREMMEEAGLDVEAGGFRGVAENSFMQKGAPHSEYRLPGAGGTKEELVSAIRSTGTQVRYKVLPSDEKPSFSLDNIPVPKAGGNRRLCIDYSSVVLVYREAGGARNSERRRLRF